MPIYQSTLDQRTWTADSAAALIDAIRGQAAANPNDVIAFMVQWPPRPPGTVIRADAPDNWLEDAIQRGFIKVVNAPGSDAAKDEWKECRSAIGRFDGLLVDLRKTGFGFVTAIVSGATFFFTYDQTKPVPESGKFAVFSIIMVLTLTLYLIDRVHQVLLQDAVDHARTLEARLGFNLSGALSRRYQRKHAIRLGLAIYIVLLAAVFLASLFSSDAWRAGTFAAWLGSIYQPIMLAELIVGIIGIEVVVRKTS